MSYFSTDVETNGPIPGKFSMLKIGIVKVTKNLDSIFGAKLKPISNNYEPEALAVVGCSHEESLLFDDPEQKMRECEEYILTTTKDRPIMISDNNGFDHMFVCFYFHYFLGRNPFGYSSVNLGSIYKGMVKTMRHNFKHLRITEHDHNPVHDAMGNAEALLAMQDLGLEIELS